MPGALLIGGIIAAVVSAVAGLTGSLINYNGTLETNAKNIQAQKDINDQNLMYQKEFAQNNINWKMQDLQQSGLNPVLAAQGAIGGVSSPTALQAPHAQVPTVDLSSLGSAITAMNNTMLTAAILDSKGKGSGLLQKAVDSSSYRNMSNTSAHIGNARQIAEGTVKSASWEKLLDELDKIPYKYKWK